MQVALAWNPSPTASTYNVYRSQTSGSGYQPIFIGLTQTNYTDGPSNLDTSTIYYYVVTGVTATLIESVFSNQITATPVGVSTAPAGLAGVIS